MDINKKELHELFQGIKQGSRTALEVLYKRYNQLVYKIAFSIIKNKENSEDIMQNVFTKIFELPEIKLPDNKEASWLYTVTKNETITKLRKLKEDIDIDSIYNMTTDCKDIENIIDNDKYNRIINKLDEKEQEIVSLKILGQLSFKEISKLMDIPIGTVQWHYYKAIDCIKILIGNISMFIVTTVLYLKNKLINKVEMSQAIEESNVIQEDSKEEEKTSQDSTENSEQLENERIENVEGNTQISETIEIDTKNTLLNNVENKILLGSSTLFLILTIIFSIICIKYQQNKKKKTSK